MELGLAIARQIVTKKHGGAIAVNSTAGMVLSLRSCYLLAKKVISH